MRSVTFHHAEEPAAVGIPHRDIQPCASKNSWVGVDILLCGINGDLCDSSNGRVERENSPNVHNGGPRRDAPCCTAGAREKAKEERKQSQHHVDATTAASQS